MSLIVRGLTSACFLLALTATLSTSDIRPAYADDGLCADFALDVAEEEIPVGMHCNVERATIGGRVYIFAEFLDFRSPTRGLDHIRLAREAVERAQPAYDPHFRLPRATIFFGNAPASGAVAVGITHGDATDCVIYIDNGALAGLEATDSAANEFRRTVAHELFHCSQDAHPILAVAYNSNEEDRWWVEGSAEYFAGLAIPESQPGLAFYGGFVEAIFNHPLYSIGDAGYVFFAFLHRERGVEAVVALLNNVERRSGEVSEQTLLQSIPDFDRLFNQFARKLYDGLEDESGRRLPIYPPESPVVELTGDVRVPKDILPFTFNARTFHAAENSRYRIEPAEYDGPLQAALADTPGEWRELTTHIGSCRRETDAVLVFTSTSRRAGPARAVFPVFSEASARLSDCQCPIGTWSIPSGNMWEFRASINHTLSGYGSAYIIFNSDGTATFHATNVESSYEIPNSGGATNTISRDYEANWTWRVEGNLLFMIQNNMTITETVTDRMPGAAERVRGPRTRVLPPDATSGWGRAFSCVGGSLRIERPARRLGGLPGGARPRENDYPHWGTYGSGG